MQTIKGLIHVAGQGVPVQVKKMAVASLLERAHAAIWFLHSLALHCLPTPCSLDIGLQHSLQTQLGQLGIPVWQVAQCQSSRKGGHQKQQQNEYDFKGHENALSKATAVLI